MATAKKSATAKKPLKPPYDPDAPEGLKVAVSVERTINLENYENVKVFLSVSGVAAGSTDEEIEEAMVTGDRAWEMLKDRMLQRMDDARKELAG